MKLFMRALIVVPISFFLAGCPLMQPRVDTAEFQLPLKDVVDAVQYAVNEISKESPWVGTAAERKHWDEACENGTAAADQSCFDVFAKARELCEAQCTGTCSPGKEELCRRYIAGKDHEFACHSAPAESALGQWCRSAVKCTVNRKRAAQVCKNAESISVPVLKSAVLNMAVAEGFDAGAKVNIIVVSFGMEQKAVASNTVQLLMKPRVQDKTYGNLNVPTGPLEILPATERAEKMASDLVAMIRMAVAASIKEIPLPPRPPSPPMGGHRPPGSAPSAQAPPMALAGLEIGFTLEVEKGGKLGVKKEWSMPAGIELGGGPSSKKTNSLTLTFARPE